MSIILLLMALQGSEWNIDKPPELKALEDDRAGIRAAAIRWTLTRPGNELPVQRYANRIAGDDLVFSEFGDDLGVRGFTINEKGERLPSRSMPDHLLSRNDELWMYTEDELIADVYSAKQAPQALDIRSIGLVALPKFDAPWHTYLDDHSKRIPRYKTERNDHETIVEMTYGESPRELFRWTLSAEYGYQPVKCEWVVDGRLHRSAKFDYQSVGADQFFVRRAEYLNEDGALTAAIDVTKAEINSPNLPARLTPEDIGVGNGVNLHYKEGHPKRNDGVHIYCDGESLISDEFTQRQTTVGVKPGAVFARRFPFLQEQYERTIQTNRDSNEAASMTSTSASSQPSSQPALSEWERYTIDFIADYRLSDEQAQKALSILHECQDQAWAHHRRVADKLERIDRSLAATVAETQPALDAEALKRERATLLEPIQAIFDQQLKPRLDKLPTRAQRASRATSKPTTTP